METQTQETEQVEATETAQDDFKPETVYFSPAELGNAQAYVEKVAAYCKAHGLSDVSQTFDDDFFEKDESNGYGVSVCVITERDQSPAKKGNIITGAVVAAIPSFECLSETSEGQNWIRSRVLDQLHAKVVQAEKKSQKDDFANYPLAVSDFIAQKKTATLEVFNLIGGETLKKLKERNAHFKKLNISTFRQILQSSAYASNMFENVSQDSWVKVLNLMSKTAEAMEKDTTVFQHWLATRDNFDPNAEISDDDILGSLGLDDDEDETDEGSETE